MKKNTPKKHRNMHISSEFFFLLGGIAFLEALFFLFRENPLQVLGLFGISLLLFPPFEKKLIQKFHVDLCQKRRDIALFSGLFFFFLGSAI